MNYEQTSIASTHSSEDGQSKPDSPGVIVLPPLLYGGTLLLGVALHFLWPMHISRSVWLRIAGGILALLSGLTAQRAAKVMRRAGTNVLPNKPTLAIVTEGPFRFSRNPLYLTNALFYVGLAIAFNMLWPLLLFVPMICIVHWGIILREERYLEAKFGEQYRAYKARVPRWL